MEIGDDFSIIYNFITIFMSNVYSKLNDGSNFVFNCKKNKLGI